ncbi:hypothetical protein GIB67_033725 [Kingdonia uniflora]|uniref:Receptor-like serine/threonine-protein kinase n=1 Tax=Kingdonia uniflora TaxID=39325 RepID=A0A7J7P4E2_9MAGN|nr:hypothetical protein GIB67_033725 [Kingdonia uniflora]
MATIILLFLLLSGLSTITAQQKYSNITLGSSLSPKTNPSSWLSPSGQFAFGFYPEGEDDFIVAIWFAQVPEKTVIWTYNQDDPKNPSNVTLQMTTDGRLVLQTARGQAKDIPTATDSASSASMLDSGNFVLYDSNLDVLWESFNSPTDTIVQGQRLLADSRLVSSASRTDHSKGRFILGMQTDGNLVQYPYTDTSWATPWYSYWSSNTYGAGDNVTVNLDKNGHLYLLNSTGFNIRNLSPAVSPSDGTIYYRMTIDVDGIFRLYSLSPSDNWSIKWSSTEDKCEPKGLCGLNGYCTLSDQESVCRCLPGFDFVNQAQRMLGCGKNTSEYGCEKENYSMRLLDSTEWEDNPYAILSSPNIQDCEEMCLTDCNCEAAIFSNLKCSKQRLPLRFGRRVINSESTALIKVGNRRFTTTNEPEPNKQGKKVLSHEILITIVVIAIVAFIVLMVSGVLIYRYRVWVYHQLPDTGRIGLNEEITLQSFTYLELEKATNGFREEVGRGSFGTVFKGVISNGERIIAVKRLERVVDEGEREFRTEMRVIGRTHHKNLVRLLGYCHEGSNRLLVYEYMCNGSLENFLFKPEKYPSWDERVGIALNIARGILYLHEECETQIIHCDIKPQNILMDEFFCAKISDFGLAKLLKPDQTKTFTGIRGTRGYVAPEWHRNLPITVKADVYSYGIMLMEIICCRKKLDTELQEDEIVLSDWVLQCFEEGDLGKLVDDEVVDKKRLERMVKVALWCIQDDPALRPHMKKVVLMLEGTIEIPVPPGPSSFLSSI